MVQNYIRKQKWEQIRKA